MDLTQEAQEMTIWAHEATFTAAGLRCEVQTTRPEALMIAVEAVLDELSFPLRAPGTTAPAQAAERVATALAGYLPGGVWIDIAGNIVSRGERPDDGWPLPSAA